MCGVIGLRCESDRADLGRTASALLRMLEYRGYDSTGALIQDGAGGIILRKDVGSPTVITKKLGIDKLGGKLFCGQVRWATFGMVTKENAQPHDVHCHSDPSQIAVTRCPGFVSPPTEIVAPICEIR